MYCMRCQAVWVECGLYCPTCQRRINREIAERAQKFQGIPKILEKDQDN